MRKKVEEMEAIIPELSLVYAVLERAVLDAASEAAFGNNRETLKQSGALNWIQERDTEDINAAWSFRWVCEHLDVCPIRTRKNILKIINRKGKNLKTQLGWFAFNGRMFEDVPSCGDANFFYTDIIEDNTIRTLTTKTTKSNT